MTKKEFAVKMESVLMDKGFHEEGAERCTKHIIETITNTIDDDEEIETTHFNDLRVIGEAIYEITNDILY